MPLSSNPRGGGAPDLSDDHLPLGITAQCYNYTCSFAINRLSVRGNRTQSAAAVFRSFTKMFSVRSQKGLMKKIPFVHKKVLSSVKKVQA